MDPASPTSAVEIALKQLHEHLINLLVEVLEQRNTTTTLSIIDKDILEIAKHFQPCRSDTSRIQTMPAILMKSDHLARQLITSPFSTSIRENEGSAIFARMKEDIIELKRDARQHQTAEEFDPDSSDDCDDYEILGEDEIYPSRRSRSYPYGRLTQTDQVPLFGGTEYTNPLLHLYYAKPSQSTVPPSQPTPNSSGDIAVQAQTQTPQAKPAW